MSLKPRQPRAFFLFLLYGFVVGFLLWALSEPLWGVAEPWDTGCPYYSVAMVCTGLVLGFAGARTMAPATIGVWLGQVAALVVLPSFDKGWLLLGVITTGLGSLIFFFGVIVGWLARELIRSRRAT